MRSSSSLVRTLAFQGLQWSSYKDYLSKKYSKDYAVILYRYAIKYHYCLTDASRLSSLPVTIRSNVLKACISLSKFLGTYEEFTKSFKNHGIKWTTTDSFNSFLNIINGNHESLKVWYNKAKDILPDNEKLYLRFTLLSGLRRSESLKAFNMLIDLAKQNRISDYYDKDSQCLCHFKYPIFLRKTKNAFITPMTEELVLEIANSKPVSYATLRKHLCKNQLSVMIKPLRSYYATFLNKHGFQSESIDIVQGRIAKSVFARHYLKENLKALNSQVIALLKVLENSMLS